MKGLSEWHLRAGWRLLIPVAAGVGIFAALRLTRPTPATLDREERTRVLRVVRAAPVDVVPRAIGYGTAKPGRTWRAVARVEGRVISVSKRLRPGARISAGEDLIRLDPTSYELAIVRIEADTARTEAELAELAVGLANDLAAIAIEKESLELAETGLERLEQLHEQGNVSQSEVDSSKREVLAQRQSVQKLRNSLSLTPAQRKTKETTLAAQRASLKDAQLDLEHTALKAPYAGRLADLSLEVGQYVSRGEFLFELYGGDRLVIDSQLLYSQGKKLVSPESAARLREIQESGDLSGEAVAGLLEVLVRTRSGELSAEWKGRLVGTREIIDAATRALSIRVAVDDPYGQTIPGVRPELLKGTFCEVEFRGRTLPGQIVLPRSAVREGVAYVLDSARRLRRRPVSVRFRQGDAVILDEGIQSGELVVVSDLGPAIEGSLVEPVVDEGLLEMLSAQAAGQGALR